MRKFRDFFGSATPIEYGLIFALIAVAAISAMQGLGDQFKSTVDKPVAETRPVPTGCWSLYIGEEDRIEISCREGYRIAPGDRGKTFIITPPPTPLKK